MGPIKLIAVDLDGTLLTSQGQLAARGAALLARAAQDGVYVVLATARNTYAACAFGQQMQLQHPLICTNGAQVWASPGGPLWASYTIPLPVALEIAGLADESDWELGITVGEMSYWRLRPGGQLGQISPNRAVVRTNREMLTGDPIRMISFDPRAILALHGLCRERYAGQCVAEVYYDAQGQPGSLGIFPLRADKGTALRLVLEKLGLSPQEALAIGDNVADLPMLKLAGVGVAMGNAPEMVKYQVNVVAPGNDDEGVAWAVETFIYNGKIVSP